MKEELTLDEVNTSYPGKVISFNPVEQTATIELQIEKYLDTYDEEHVKYDIPELQEVPCYFPRVKGFSITMPVEAGDECLVFFAHNGIDHWLYEGKKEAGLLEDMPSPDIQRKFDLSDAFAIVGFSNLTRVIKNFNPTDVELRNEGGDQIVRLKKDKDLELITPTHVLVDAPNTTMTGNQRVNGNVVVDGNHTTMGTGHVEGALHTNGAFTGATTGGFGAAVTAPNFAIGVGAAVVAATTQAAKMVIETMAAAVSGLDMLNLIAKYNAHVHPAGSIKDGEARGCSGDSAVTTSEVV